MLENDLKRITLSFDNGPDPETTPLVLEILARRRIKTTFFVVGQKLAKARAPAERAVQEGHWIGNHTWSHSHPFRAKGEIEFVTTEIERTQELIGDLARPEKLFRPFGGGGRLDGALNTHASNHLSKEKYTCVLWNSVPGDFRDEAGWPAVADQQIAALDWPLVVLHDIYAGAMQRLDGFLGALQDRGYAFEQQFPPDCIAMKCGIHTPLMQAGVLSD